MGNKEITPPIKKVKTPAPSYVVGYANVPDRISHFGLDKLEVTFEACSETFLELAKKSHGTHGTIKFRFNENSANEYECYFKVMSSDGYAKGISVTYKGTAHDDELFFVSFPRANSDYRSKLRIDGKMFRFCRLDKFGFDVIDILNFFEKHFKDPKVYQFDLCADLKVDRKTADAGFLSDVFQEINDRRFGGLNGADRTRGTNLHIVLDGGSTGRTIYDGYDPNAKEKNGKEKDKNSDTYIVRIYDKTYQIETDSRITHLYNAYLDSAKTIRIFRFEISFLKKTVKNNPIAYEDLKNPHKIWGLFMSQFNKRNIPVFEGLEYEKTKNKKAKSSLGGGDVYKIETMKGKRQLKAVITGIDKFMAEGIDVLKIRRNLIKNPNGPGDRKDEFVFYYENILDSILGFLKNGDCRYQDFIKEISGHINLIEQSTKVTFDVFISIVNGFVRPSLELLAKEHYKSLMLMAYVCYKHKIPLGDDKVLRFLRVFDEEEILDFSEKHLKAEIKKINSSKSVQFIYKQMDANKPENPKNKDFLLSLLQKASEVNNYS